MKNGRADFMIMTQDEKIVLVEKIFITYPLFDEIVKAITDCHDRIRKGRKAKCFFITGESGAGKSTMVENYAHKYPRMETETGAIIPVLLSKIFTPVTVKGMVTGLLKDLGDPCPEKGTKVTQTLRLIKLIKDCKVELIFLDEFNDLIDRDTDKVLKEAAKWLRFFVDGTKISIVVIGLPSSERILRENSQLRRRFSARKDLMPFEYITIEDRQNLRKLLYAIESQLPLSETSNLADPDTALRIYHATHGLIGYIMKIICSAAEAAIRVNSNKITMDMLAEAYEKEVSSVDPNKGNPFRLEKQELKKRSMEAFTEDDSQREEQDEAVCANASEVLIKKPHKKSK